MRLLLSLHSFFNVVVTTFFTIRMTNVYIVSERSLELGGSRESKQKRPATVAVLGSKTRILSTASFLCY